VQTNSLSFRLLVSAAFVLATFFALVSIVLEQSFRESAEQALKEKLQVHVYSLLSAAEMDENGGLKMPFSLPEPRFSTPGSGLYAFIQQKNKIIEWRSSSAIGLNVIFPADLISGKTVFVTNEHGRYALHYDVIWQTVTKQDHEYVFTVAEDALFVQNQVNQFNSSLRVWLLIIGIILIFLQFAVMRWSLKPLRIIVKDLEDVENGAKSSLDGNYSTELQGLASNMNALITSERALQERYRHTLADLAHNLKMPLSILRGCVTNISENTETVHEQIDRMNQIVEWQLQRAAAKGKQKTTRTIDVPTVINKIISSVAKAYFEKGITFEANMPDKLTLYCDEGDLYEIAGNLIDNAGKFCYRKVKVSVAANARRGRKKFTCLLQVEDDGLGIPEGKLEKILERGVRADLNTHGHGIGMAVVNELTGQLEGRLEGGRSAELGGVKWKVFLP
jgi:two-component system sensor histidine kinase PhoQ